MFRRQPPFAGRGILKALTGVAIIAGGVLLARETAQAGDPISVMIDRAKVMRISRPADTVIIGNPAIADAAIQDNRTLIITGRSFGTTNLIVLDAEGQPIADELLTVEAPDDSVVTVYKRADRQTLSCNPECGPMLAIGDNTSAFDTVKSQISDHQAISDAATSK
jgi:Flp pilus assembly secretin CpaC